MDYLEYKNNHFGKPVDIYTSEDKLVYAEIVPKEATGVSYSVGAGADVFNFEVGDEGTSFSIPLDSVLKLSSQNTVTDEERI